MNGKRLYRSESSRMLCGVCAGIAEYFNLCLLYTSDAADEL